MSRDRDFQIHKDGVVTGFGVGLFLGLLLGAGAVGLLANVDAKAPAHVESRARGKGTP